MHAGGGDTQLLLILARIGFLQFLLGPFQPTLLLCVCHFAGVLRVTVTLIHPESHSDLEFEAGKRMVRARNTIFRHFMLVLPLVCVVIESGARIYQFPIHLQTSNPTGASVVSAPRFSLSSLSSLFSRAPFELPCYVRPWCWPQPAMQMQMQMERVCLTNGSGKVATYSQREAKCNTNTSSIVFNTAAEAWRRQRDQYPSNRFKYP